jgi:hypothetical protein
MKDWHAKNRKEVKSETTHYDGNEHSKEENDNHSNQLNDNNDAYWDSRDEDKPE